MQPETNLEDNHPVTFTLRYHQRIVQLAGAICLRLGHERIWDGLDLAVLAAGAWYAQPDRPEGVPTVRIADHLSHVISWGETTLSPEAAVAKARARMEQEDAARRDIARRAREVAS